MTAQARILLQRLDPGLPVPCTAHQGDAGVDLHAAEDAVLAPGERALIRTGIAIALPLGYAAFVHPRSGLAARHGITTLNSPGTIDAGFRGEIRVNLINHDPRETFTVRRGDRIAQLVVHAVATPVFEEADCLPGSTRGTGGHGSSGGFGAPGGPDVTTDERD